MILTMFVVHYSNCDTVMIPSVWTDRPLQTVQTLIRLLEEQSDRVYTVYHSICTVGHFFRMNFRVLAENILAVQK